jgi:hypothetical protein
MPKICIGFMMRVAWFAGAGVLLEGKPQAEEFDAAGDGSTQRMALFRAAESTDRVHLRELGCRSFRELGRIDRDGSILDSARYFRGRPVVPSCERTASALGGAANWLGHSPTSCERPDGFTRRAA